MGKDVMYHCSKCSRTFPVKCFVSKELVRFGKKAFCPGCGLDQYTNKWGDHVTKTKKTTSLDSPATQSQLEYIKGLGGDPTIIKTKRQAGEYIGQLKKEQERIR